MTVAEAEKSRALDETTRAQAKTDRALRESEASRAKAQEVSRYLVESFRRPDPSQDGRTLKVVDLLDQAVANLDRRFADSPLVKAELLDAIATTYLGLGLRNQAVDAFSKAGDVLEAALGAEHVETLTSRHNLAVAYSQTGRTSDAIKIHERALEDL